jgi:hypothetical protein
MNKDLMQKLAISKKIMDASDNIKPGQVNVGLQTNTNVNAKYNISQEMLNEHQVQTPKVPQVPTSDRIANSKLPDEIKQLMIEHPIQQPSFGGGTVLSDDIIEGASRLMGRDSSVIKESSIPNMTTNNNELKQMVRDVVRDTVRDVIREELQNAGILTEGDTKTNESLSLRVGKHVFEGKVLKIKKIK